MKKWQQKAIVQKTISYLPFSHQINYIFQKYVTKGVFLDDNYFYDRLGHAKTHLACYAKYADGNVPDSALEIGTGWYPVVPISCFLSGTDTIYSVDISMLSNKERLLTTLQKFQEAANAGRLSEYLQIVPERWDTIETILENADPFSFEEILEQLHIHYLIEDARSLSLPDNSINLINSNNTFEHIYPALLIPILQQFNRVVKRHAGVQSHFIDMSDHFAHFDTSISMYNFLQFSDRQWKWIDNSIQPQSRLRMYDYLKMFKELGIPITESTCRPGNPALLQDFPLDEKYTDAPLEDIAISHCHIVSA